MRIFRSQKTLKSCNTYVLRIVYYVWGVIYLRLSYWTWRSSGWNRCFVCGRSSIQIWACSRLGGGFVLWKWL